MCHNNLRRRRQEPRARQPDRAIFWFRQCIHRIDPFYRTCTALSFQNGLITMDGASSSGRIYIKHHVNRGPESRSSYALAVQFFVDVEEDWYGQMIKT